MSRKELLNILVIIGGDKTCFAPNVEAKIRKTQNSAEFYNMIAKYLGSWEKFSNTDNEKPLYMTFNGNGCKLLIMGIDSIYLEGIKDFSCEQGEGKTATFSSSKGSVQVSYDMSGDNLVITVNGTDYVLSPTSITYTGKYDMFGNVKN